MSTIRRLEAAGSLRWDEHVLRRKRERAIDILDVREVLRFGEIEGPIRAGVRRGEWVCKVTAKPGTSSRKVGVVVAVVRDKELFLITVEWEDTRR